MQKNFPDEINDDAKAKPSGFDHWIYWQKIVLRSILFSVLLFSIYRLFFFWFFKTGKGTEGMAGDVAKSFITGARYDAVVASWFCLPLFVFSLLVLIFYRRSKTADHIGRRFALVYLLIVVVFSILFCAIDFYFYKYFQSHINELIFAVIDDDAKTIGLIIINGFPLFSILLCQLISGFVLYRWVIKPWIVKGEPVVKKYSFTAKALLVATSFFLMFIALRGSLPLPHNFSLRMENATVSSNTFINTVCLNPVFTFNDARINRNKKSIVPDINQLLAEGNFKNIAAALSFFRGQKITQVTLDSLFHTTPVDPLLEKEKLNVIFIQMESMSSQLLSFHEHSTLNLLGALEDELPGAYIFPNSIAGQNATVISLEDLMVNTSGLLLFPESVYVQYPFPGACALPFHKAGYQTCFLSGAKMRWRKLDKFISSQYFSLMEGEKEITEHIPQTQSTKWGAYDEFLFERMLQVLQRSTRPVFMYAMTTSNHEDFSLPASYHPFPAEMNDTLKKKSEMPLDQLQKQLITFQYANHQLGLFIKKLRASPAGKKTIVVVTGDHNIRGIETYPDAAMFKKYGVPIMFFFPDQYKPPYAIDTTRFASHKDIFPSIYCHSLSSAAYLNRGNDLLQPASGSTHFFAVNKNNFACNEYGAVLVKEKLFYKWKDKEQQELAPVKKGELPQLDTLYRMAQAYNILSVYYFAESIKR